MSMAEMSEPSDSFVGDQNVEGTESSTILFEEIETKLPPKMSNLQELKDALPNATSLSILVCGRTGTGKSTLVNGILGKRVAKEGGKLIRHGETPELVAYSQNIRGVNVTVRDSPGLQDRSDNLAQDHCIMEMREKCSTVDLMLYCIKMFEKRFPRGRSDNPDVNAMARITEAFGPEFWRKTVVVLTFANVVEAVNVDWEELDASAKEVAFQEELERWRGIIQDVLINEINVPQEIAMSVVVAPAGHYVNHQLPDRDYWLSRLWFHCLEVIATPEGRAALVRTNTLRIRRQNNLKEKDFEQCLEDQPIVVEGMSLPSADIPVRAGVAIGAITGAVFGACSSFGAVVGACMGANIGVVVAFIVAYVRTAISERCAAALAKSAS